MPVQHIYPSGRLERSQFFDGGPWTSEREQDLWALAELVEEGHAFVERELAAAPGFRHYRLRESGRRIFLRHGTPDIAILDEVFRKRLYDWPPRVEAIFGEAQSPLTVVDIGANIGLFGIFAGEHLSPETIVAFEPDPLNLELLKACIEANDGGPRWTLVAACAGTRAGSVRFRAGLFASSRIADGDFPSEDVITTPVVDVFPYLENADLIKIDIEGGEWGLLSDPRLATTPARAIVLEYHRHFSPPGAFPGRSAEHLLQAAGFETEVLHERSDGQGMIWAWR